MFDDVPDKEFLRANLPLAFVCHQLGIRLRTDGKALCPLHHDTDPSFGLYLADDGSMRWHCFPCDRGGDIFSIIMAVNGVSFPESLTQAQAMYEELKKPGTVMMEIDLGVPDPSVTVADWSPELAARREVKRGFADSLFNAKPSPQSTLFDDHASSWGWGLDENRAIYMPHFTAEGLLTGCKVRARGGDRWSLRPSKYTDLYGAWRGRINKDVLICAGETDAVWASFQALLGQIPIDVFALPAGERQPLTPDHLSFLKGKTGTIYTVLDPDPTGVEATRQMVEDLILIGGFKTVRVCTLPLGKDLRDARPNLQALLDSAQSPMAPQSSIQTPLPEGGYYLVDKEGNPHRLTEWHFEPVTRLTGEEISGYRGDLVYRGQRYDKIITLPDLSTQNKLVQWATKNGVQYTKTDTGRRAIAEWIEARASIVPHEFLAARVGVQQAPEAYRWAGKSLVYPHGHEGQLPWRYHPSELTADVTQDVLLKGGGIEFQRQPDWNWLWDFIQLSTSDVMHPILCWLVAAARRDEVQDFPLLFISGSSGVGKSTLAYLAQRLMGSEIRTDLGGNTPFVINRVLASSTSLPVFVDEWTRQSKKETLERFQEVVTTIYSGGNAQRGRADLTVVDYKMSSPIIVAGENTFSLDRERDRMVTVSPSRDGQNHLALMRLRDKPLHLIGARIHHYVATHSNLPEMDQGNLDRPTHNRLVLEAGWATLLQMLDGYDDPDIPALPETPDLSALDPELLASQNENAYEMAIQEAMSLTDKNHHALCWPGEGGTWIRAQTMIPVIEQHTDIKLPGGSRAMINYFTERYGEPVLKRVSLPGGIGTANARFFKGLIIEGAEEALDTLIKGGT